MSILDIFKRESVTISAKSTLILPGSDETRKVVCYRCEREIDERHEVEGCRKSGMSRRFFFGLAGASAAALVARLEGIPLPTARHQVVAHAGDMFEVETLNAFTIAWEGAKTRNGHPFKTDEGLVQDGGILEFHGQDVSRPDKWLRVHRGLAEMNVLELRDKVTGKPIKYRIIRSEECEKLVSVAQRRVMQDHESAANVARYAIRQAQLRVDAEIERREEVRLRPLALAAKIRDPRRLPV